MAWDKTRCEEGILAPDLNDAIRANYEALEAALTKEMNFTTGGTASLQGLLKQGSARCYFQDTAPATRIDGSAFASTDLGSIWIDSNATIDNQLNILTATTPTWTPVSTEIIATLLAAARTFAAAVTFDVAAVLSKAPTLTEGIVANNAYLQARNVADDGNVDLIKADGSDVPTVPDDTANATSGAPTADASLANKKYVDDASGQSSQAVGTTDISNATGAWADMANMSVTITTTGGNVLLLFSADFEAAAGADHWGIRFDVDGAPYHEVTTQAWDAETHPMSLHWLETALAAGAHTFKVQWKDWIGTISQSGASRPRIFSVIELPS